MNEISIATKPGKYLGIQSKCKKKIKQEVIYSVNALIKYFEMTKL